ncbi:MAG: hypothetical protein OXD44_06730 [Gammaproteobacteria bacterium]|nr:hypothetical protein [Gammaproteobacteria bacterium]
MNDARSRSCCPEACRSARSPGSWGRSSATISREIARNRGLAGLEARINQKHDRPVQDLDERCSKHRNPTHPGVHQRQLTA